jgi:hypothetical protein
VRADLVVVKLRDALPAERVLLSVIVAVEDAVFALDAVLCEIDPLAEELMVSDDSRVSDITDFVSELEAEALGVIIGGGVIDCVDVLSSVGDGDGAFVGVIVGGRVIVGGGVTDLVVDGVCVTDKSAKDFENELVRDDSTERVGHENVFVADANGNEALVEKDRECSS